MFVAGGVARVASWSCKKSPVVDGRKYPSVKIRINI